jgi:RHS repeat-associated protein
MKMCHPSRRENVMSLRLRQLLVLALIVGASGPCAASQTPTYVYTDAQGNVVARADASGMIMERSSYDPFGTRVSGLAADGPGFAGGYEYAFLGVAWIGGRLFDPALGRYLMPGSAGDPDSTRGNAYGFRSANPFRTDLGAPPRTEWQEPTAR